MALKKKTQKAISQAIQRFINFLKFRSIGPHVLTRAELKDLVRNGYITSASPTRTAVTQAYLKTHRMALDTEPASQTMQQGAQDFLERMFDNYANKAGEQFKADIMGTIESNLMSLFNRKEGTHIYGLLKDPDKFKKNLGAELRGKVDAWQQRWKTIVTTELNRASNWGAMDAILTNNSEKAPDEIYVYKIGPLDEATCKFCTKFWFHNGTQVPKVYRLQELMQNGSNIGRKQKDWKPTVDSTHPNERHILHELKPGWGFDSGGDLTFRGKGHHEYAHQSAGLRKNDPSIVIRVEPDETHGCGHGLALLRSFWPELM